LKGGSGEGVVPGELVDVGLFILLTVQGEERKEGTQRGGAKVPGLAWQSGEELKKTNGVPAPTTPSKGQCASDGNGGGFGPP